MAAEALLLMIGTTRPRTGFGLGRAALHFSPRRCWRRNFPRRCRVRAMVGASQVRTSGGLSVVGVRHGHRERTLTGNVWQDADRRAARSVDRRGR